MHKASITSSPSGVMMDSIPIVEHLDKVFPSPPFFPSGDASYALMVAVNSLMGRLRTVFMTMVVPRVPEHLDPRGQEYFVRTRSEAFGKPLSEVRPKDEKSLQEGWQAIEEVCMPLTKMLKGREGKKGPFFEGETAGYADLLLASFLAFFHRIEPDLWEKMMKLGDGELKALWDATSQWVDGQVEEKEWPIPQ